MSGPVIGIAGASYVVMRPWGILPVHGVPRAYAEQVAAAGGRPVLLPPLAGLDVLDVLDGVVLAGGGDVDPRLYGSPGSTARDVDPTRDAVELALVRAARSAGVPLLGVCRGIQLMAVVDGGALEPELGVRHIIPTRTHPVTTSPGSACAHLLGGRAEVSSLHHQSVRSTGTSWSVTARTDDGVVEALEWIDPRAPWPALGVQWHPEMDATGPALFGWLVEQATHRRSVIRIVASSAPSV